jgi:hypothetical protein
MSDRKSWRRVNHERPCGICGRPDWCLLSEDATAAICARTESSKRCGDAGWLHRLVDRPWQPRRRFVRSVEITFGQRGRDDLADLARQFQAAVNPADIDKLARQLGLTVASLHSLGIGWTGRAWSFPMTDASGQTLGIRLRFPDGRKLAVTGGREGLFIPSINSDAQKNPVFITEGPTDAAALLDMGFHQVVGRPSCTGGIKLLAALVRDRRPDEVVIVADGDEPGERGANSLASVLVAYARVVRIIQPPSGIKDARAWLRAGGTKQDIQMAIDAAPVRRLTVRAVAQAKVSTWK